MEVAGILGSVPGPLGTSPSNVPNRSPQAAEAEDTGVGAGGEEFGTRESRGNPLRGGNLDPGKLSSEV